jgi:hypothetical protein
MQIKTCLGDGEVCLPASGHQTGVVMEIIWSGERVEWGVCATVYDVKLIIQIIEYKIWKMKF